MTDSELKTLTTLRRVFPHIPVLTLLRHIREGQQERAHLACIERHRGLTMDNYNENANYPCGIGYGGSK